MFCFVCLFLETKFCIRFELRRNFFVPGNFIFLFLLFFFVCFFFLFLFFFFRSFFTSRNFLVFSVFFFLFTTKKIMVERRVN